MDMKIGLDMEQSQKLVMTPELRQAITILQFSATDLMQFVQEQLQENPVLETQEAADPEEEKWEKEDETEIEWEDYLRQWGTGEESPLTRESGSQWVEYLSEDAPTLEQYLREQLLDLPRQTQEIEPIVEDVIGNLDENGYLETSVEEMSGRLDVASSTVEQALQIVQSLEPAGVGARDLKECLQLQLADDPYADPLAEDVIAYYMDDLAARRFQKMASALNVSIEEIQTVADFIQTLDPRPGNCFHPSKAEYITPDVTVEEVEGEYVVLVNDRVMPRLGINQDYENLLRHSDPQARDFVHKRRDAALWLVKNIEQRRVTLYRVTKAIVEAQKPFLQKGIDYLKPMTLKDIAERVELHESTVSRAVNQKYVQLPGGLYELREFFTSGFSTEKGDTTSATSVKHRLKRLIDAEDKKKPWSDQKLTEHLQGKGVDVSRRTVAKYREELGVLSSSKRKRHG